MNTKGILVAALLVVFGVSPIMCQIEAGKEVPLGIAKVAAAVNAKIEGGQRVRIIINGVPAEHKARIDAIYRVSEAGKINLPYIGEIMAAGRSKEDLKTDIENALVDADIFKSPNISVISQVHIGGQVKRNGPVDFADGMTVGDALNAAGGPTEFGSLMRVKVYRNGKATTFDLTKKGNLRVSLKENDTIEVLQKNWFGK